MNWFYFLFIYPLITNNECLNAHDIQIWNATGQINFRDYMNTCGHQCTGNYACTVSCVQKIENYTTSCCKLFWFTWRMHSKKLFYRLYWWRYSSM